MLRLHVIGYKKRWEKLGGPGQGRARSQFKLKGELKKRI